LIALPHSLCKAACSEDGDRDLADDDTISEALDATEELVADHGLGEASSGAGGGTDSSISSAFLNRSEI
jgi:hypothetical protein